MVYYIGMVQPKTPPTSLRVPPDVMALVDAWAERYKCTRHSALLRLIGIGLAGEAGMVAAYAHEQRVRQGGRARKAAADNLPIAPKLSVPLIGTFERKPYQKGTKK